MKNANDHYIKIRLTGELKNEISNRAKRLGLTMSGYMKYLAIKDVAEAEQRTEMLIIKDVDEIMKALQQIKLKKSFTMLNALERRPTHY
jgi:antitoxin component of RelBE/YafQ-DinJ toxin-antitoxin module